MSDQFVAEIRIFAGNFAPNGWAFCNGQLLAISQNTALFSLIGTYYGGNGTSNFALPNLQGSIPVGQGQGPGLSNYQIGETGGVENVTILNSEMPLHTHLANVSSIGGDVGTPSTSAVWAASTDGDTPYGPTGNTTMSPSALKLTGGSSPHNNLQPYLALNYIIALTGIYPPRT